MEVIEGAASRSTNSGLLAGLCVCVCGVCVVCVSGHQTLQSIKAEAWNFAGSYDVVELAVRVVMKVCSRDLSLSPCL